MALVLSAWGAPCGEAKAETPEADVLPTAASRPAGTVHATSDDTSNERGGPRPGASPKPAQARTADAADAPNVWLTSLEVALSLGAGSLWYVIDDRNVLDWDQPSLKERLNGEAWRFDSNTFSINYVFHPLSGAAFHALARSNNLGFWGSGLASFAGSSTWEYVIEFNEKVSINDMLVTPLGGVPIGEFAHKLGEHLAETEPPTTLGRVVASTLGPTVALNDWLNGRERSRPGCRAGNPHACSYWHDFRLGLELSWLDSPHGGRSAHEALSFQGTLVSLPGYRTAPKLARWFGNGEVSRLRLDMARGQGRIVGQVDAETLLMGFHFQEFDEHGQRPDGIALSTAAALGYRYRSGRARGFDDRQGLLHIASPALDLYAKSGWFGAELRCRAALDFVGISSVAGHEWLRLHRSAPSVRTKTVVQRERYFFGWGPSGSLMARAWAGPLWAEGNWFVGRYDSTEGLDRAQEEVTNDVDLDEIIDEYDYRLGVSPMFGVGIAAFRKVNKRLSYAGVHSTSVRVEELGLSLSVSF